jgi:hypothetical protein
VKKKEKKLIKNYNANSELFFKYCDQLKGDEVAEFTTKVLQALCLLTPNYQFELLISRLYALTRRNAAAAAILGTPSPKETIQ